MSYRLDAGGAELGIECMTRAARQCTDAMALGVAQNSHRRATVRPRAFGAWVVQHSLAGLFGSAAGHPCVLRLIAKGRSGARLFHVIKHGGFERKRTVPALRETVAPLETLCATGVRTEEMVGQCS